jgi:hypothetical protein
MMDDLSHATGPSHLMGYSFFQVQMSDMQSRVSDCQCQSCGFDPSFLQNSGTLGVADEAVLNVDSNEKLGGPKRRQ